MFSYIMKSVFITPAPGTLKEPVEEINRVLERIIRLTGERKFYFFVIALWDSKCFIYRMINQFISSTTKMNYKY